MQLVHGELPPLRLQPAQLRKLHHGQANREGVLQHVHGRLRGAVQAVPQLQAVRRVPLHLRPLRPVLAHPEGQGGVRRGGVQAVHDVRAVRHLRLHRRLPLRPVPSVRRRAGLPGAGLRRRLQPAPCGDRAAGGSQLVRHQPEPAGHGDAPFRRRGPCWLHGLLRRLRLHQSGGVHRRRLRLPRRGRPTYKSPPSGEALALLLQPRPHGDGGARGGASERSSGAQHPRGFAHSASAAAPGLGLGAHRRAQSPPRGPLGAHCGGPDVRPSARGDQSADDICRRRGAHHRPRGEGDRTQPLGAARQRLRPGDVACGNRHSSRRRGAGRARRVANPARHDAGALQHTRANPQPSYSRASPGRRHQPAGVPHAAASSPHRHVRVRPGLLAAVRRELHRLRALRRVHGMQRLQCQVLLLLRRLRRRGVRSGPLHLLPALLRVLRLHQLRGVHLVQSGCQHRLPHAQRGRG
mmetsp:Transcript_19096/g.36513  ORF Transcript_19096/g.36513 Transcript_19096/m.36513 type:complete len:465 (-) Transcript_19096:661-2055(-)